jgi:MerR family transcriptional regulator, light-induced transcriptional regulator
METQGLRIGAVARRTGVAVATLRAWESRYGVLCPGRTDGGHRLYAEQDVDRVLAVLRLTSQGWSVAAAARAVTGADAPGRLGLVPDPGARGVPGDSTADTAADDTVLHDAPAMRRHREDLERAVRAFASDDAEATLDDAFARFGVAHTLQHVVMPVLRAIGEGWQDDPMLVAAEHFATNALRPRLQRLLMGARGALSPTCLAAAPDGEAHELGVLAAAAVAADRGFRVTYLGSSTPTSALDRSIATIRPDVVLVGTVSQEAADRLVAQPPDLAGARLIVGGPGFSGIDVASLPAGTLRAESLTTLGAVLQRALERSDAAG